MNINPTKQSPAEMLAEFKAGWIAAGFRATEEIEAAFLTGMASGIGVSFDKCPQQIEELLLQVIDISETKLQLLELGIIG